MTAEKTPKVFITWADGSQDKFEFTAELLDRFEPGYAKYHFTPLEETTAKLEVVGCSADLDIDSKSTKVKGVRIKGVRAQELYN